MSLSNTKWNCTRCTLQQSAYNHVCEICGETNKDVIQSPSKPQPTYFRSHTTKAHFAGVKPWHIHGHDYSWDHYYMDLVFKACIMRWTVDESGQRNGGYININGENMSRQIPFGLTNIKNYEYLSKHSNHITETNIAIECQVGMYHGQQCAKDIRIVPVHQGNVNKTQSLKGIIKMIPTHSVNGIIFCPSLNEAIRFKHEFDKTLTLEQEVRFNYKRMCEFDKIRHIGTDVTATTSMSSNELRQTCLTKMGQSHLNSSYLVQNTEMNIREDMFYELKHFNRYKTDVKYGNGIKQMVAVMMKNMNAFMNGKGGVLLVGITDKGKIKGIPHVTRYVEDKIRISIAHSLRSWQPNLVELRRAYRMEFVGVIRMQANKGYVLPDTKVIMVTVKPVFSSFGRQRQVIFRAQVSPFDRHTMKAFIRNDASVSEHKYGGFPHYYQQDCVYVLNEKELEFNVRNHRKHNEAKLVHKCDDTLDINELLEALSVPVQPNVSSKEEKDDQSGTDMELDDGSESDID